MSLARCCTARHLRTDISEWGVHADYHHAVQLMPCMKYAVDREVVGILHKGWQPHCVNHTDSFGVTVHGSTSHFQFLAKQED